MMPAPHISLASKNDLDDILEIEINCFGAHAWTKEMFKVVLSDVTCKTFVYKDALGTTIGFSILRVVADEAEIDNLAIYPKFKRLGFGKALVEKMIANAKKAGATTMFLEVDTTSLPAIALYESLGFVKLGLRKNYYGTADAYTYSLLL